MSNVICQNFVALAVTVQSLPSSRQGMPGSRYHGTITFEIMVAEVYDLDFTTHYFSVVILVVRFLG